VRPEGIEPPAYRFEACRSIQLSYGRTEDLSVAMPRQEYHAVSCRAMWVSEPRIDSTQAGFPLIGSIICSSVSNKARRCSVGMVDQTATAESMVARPFGQAGAAQSAKEARCDKRSCGRSFS
jgi:hypothetical protein